MENTQNKEFRIGFGALVPPIPKQLKEQGFKFDAEKAKHFEKLRDCLTHLMFSDILNDSQCEKARQKLFNKIRKHIMEKNKIKIA